MMLVLVLSGLALWAGVALLLAELPWFAREPLVERLAPYAPGGGRRRPRAGLLSAASFRDAIGPFARDLGARCSQLVGIHDDLEQRLARVHAQLDATELRIRQLGWSLVGVCVGTLVTVVARPPVAVGVLTIVGAGVLAFLVVEQQVTVASQRWQRTLRLELPVVAEQIAMLLGAGYSLHGALDRITRRGHGAVAADLRRVLVRRRQGVAIEVALREWAELADVPAVDRLVAVLAVERDAGDLGRLLAAESRAIRRDAHRDLIELLERRGQQVWIPVTVATLLPGVLFLAIPLRAALRDFLL